MRRPRRSSVDQVAIVPVAQVAGLLAAFSSASPTGDNVLDVVLVGLGSAVLTWICASASWWALLFASGMAMGISLSVAAAVPAVVGLGLAIWISIRRRSMSVHRAAVGGLVVNSLLRSDLEGFAGLSSIISLTVVVILFANAVQRRNRRQRQWIYGITIGLLSYSVITGGMLGASALSARSTLDKAIDSVRKGLDELTAGDVDAALTTLNEGARQLDRVRRNVSTSWTQPARLVPIVAQHRRSIDELSGRAADLVDTMIAEVVGLDIETLRPTAGQFDLTAIEDAGGSISRLLESVRRLEGTISETASMWLIAPLRNEIDRFDSELARQQARLTDAESVLVQLPHLLGRDETRRYFIAFTTPAEARGSGGFMGSWAELTADGGLLNVTRQGRTSELNRAGGPARRISGPSDFVSTWGPFGFTSGAGGTTASDVWSNITMSGHFPSTSQVISELYPQSGGRPVDGVFALDVEALATFLQFTGGVTIPDVAEPISSDNAVQFLLFDQYRLGSGREDVLAGVSNAVVQSLLSGSLPGPKQLVDALAPAAAEGRIVAYAARPEEQDLFEQLNISGALPVTATDDVIAVAFNNASASKLELFLDADMTYDMTMDESGILQGTLALSLTNSAPTVGWPEGVIGNYIDEPPGTNRLMVVLYSRFAPDSAILDGEPVSSSIGVEAGYVVSRWFVLLPPGSSKTLTVSISGMLDAREIEDGFMPLIIRTPAMVRPMPAKVTYLNPEGETFTFETDRPGLYIRPGSSENLAPK